MNWIIVCWIIFCIVAVTTYYNICIRPKLNVRTDDSDFSDYYIFPPKDIHPEIFHSSGKPTQLQFTIKSDAIRYSTMKILLHQINKHEEFLFDERGIDVLQYYEIDRILPKRWRKELEKNGEVYLANPTTKTILLIKEWNFNAWSYKV